MQAGASIERLCAAAYTIPTDGPEADGTFAWDSTTMVVVRADGAGKSGIGYTYADACIVSLITGGLADVVVGLDLCDVSQAWETMQRRVRNLGRGGLAACAISAVDTALWDLKARVLETPLAMLLGRRRDKAPIYGSGGFTTYSNAQLSEQLAGWVERDGCRWVKMKIGSAPKEDPARVEAAKSAIGDAALFVDANGAFSTRQALDFAAACAEQDIRWFEEPVTSDDPAGLRRVRDGAPPQTDVAAGEYIYNVDDARRLLDAEAVDVLQADVTRCGGYTGFLEVAALCEAHHIDLSGHCGPALHLPVACAAHRLRHLEWFHDHARIEQRLFDGAPRPIDGAIAPDLSQPGNGLTFKSADAEPFKTAGGWP